MTKNKPSTVDEYINAAPPDAQEKLREIRSLLKEVAPNAIEMIKWGYPVLFEKRILFSYSAFNTHINFMPTGQSIKSFEKELSIYKTGKDTIQIPYDRPLASSLIRKIAEHRLKDVIENGAKWMY
jgi:uncharacterized protein YdhG (YjbR/CyaY superfamily)